MSIERKARAGTLLGRINVLSHNASPLTPASAVQCAAASHATALDRRYHILGGNGKQLRQISVMWSGPARPAPATRIGAVPASPKRMRAGPPQHLRTNSKDEFAENPGESIPDKALAAQFNAGSSSHVAELTAAERRAGLLLCHRASSA